MRSEPEFDPSSKEINILERRDAIIAVIAMLFSVVVIAVRSFDINLLSVTRVGIFNQRIIFSFHTFN